jgi:hypothetical protein
VPSKKKKSRPSFAPPPAEVLVDQPPPPKVVVRCLGWCGKTVTTTDPVGVRFCHPCRVRRDAASAGPVANSGRPRRRQSTVEH